MQAAQEALELAPPVWVERRTRLIQQQQPRPGEQRPAEGDPLLLAARQGAHRPPPHERPQIEDLGEAGKEGAIGPRAAASHPPAEVLRHAEVGQQPQVLRHVGDPPCPGPQRRQRPPVEHHRPRGQGVPTEQRLQQDRLPHPRRPDQHQVLPRRHRQLHRPEVKARQPHLQPRRGEQWRDPGRGGRADHGRELARLRWVAPPPNAAGAGRPSPPPPTPRRGGRRPRAGPTRGRCRGRWPRSRSAPGGCRQR